MGKSLRPLLLMKWQARQRVGMAPLTAADATAQEHIRKCGYKGDRETRCKTKQCAHTR